MWVTKFWINGMVSNYASVFNSFRKVLDVQKLLREDMIGSLMIYLGIGLIRDIVDLVFYLYLI
jgi:hypothetical protein